MDRSDFDREDTMPPGEYRAGFRAGRGQVAAELTELRARFGAVAYEMGCLARAAERARDRPKDLFGASDLHARDQAIHFAQLSDLFLRLSWAPDADFELDPPG